MAAQMMSKLDSEISILTRLLSHPDWNKTKLLQVYRSRIQQLKKHRDERVHFSAMKSNDYKVDRCLVHVLLYHRQGGDIHVWAKMLKNINQAVNGRPVYMDYQAAKFALTNSGREGIVSIWVRDQDLQKPLNSPGGEKYRQLYSEHVSDQFIERFICGSGKVYRYSSGVLHE